MKESKIERKFTTLIKLLGGICAKITVVGERGWPDRIVHLRGETFYVEFKRDPSLKVDSSQKHIHKRLSDCGIKVDVIGSMEQVYDLINKIKNIIYMKR